MLLQHGFLDSRIRGSETVPEFLAFDWPTPDLMFGWATAVGIFIFANLTTLNPIGLISVLEILLKAGEV